MKFKIKESFKAISIQDILNLELSINYTLPDEYKEFLITNNGGRPEPNIFKTQNNEYESDVHYFYGITSGVYSILDSYNQFDYIPRNYLTVGSDSIGNLILLELLSKEIYYYDRDIEEPFFIASNFTLFIQNLYKLRKKESEFDKAINTQNLAYFWDLVDKGNHVDTIMNEFDQPLIIVAALNNKLKIVKFCLEMSAKLDLALFNASSNGHFEIAKYLIEKGANVNETDSTQNNDTPLIQAAYGGYLNIVKLLIENGADVHKEDDHGNSAINKAYWSNNQELIAYLENI